MTDQSLLSDIYEAAKMNNKLCSFDKKLLYEVIVKKYANLSISELIRVKITFEQSIVDGKKKVIEKKNKRMEVATKEILEKNNDLDQLEKLLDNL